MHWHLMWLGVCYFIAPGVAVVVDEAMVSISNLTLYVTAGIAVLLAVLCVVIIIVCSVQMMRYRRTGLYRLNDVNVLLHHADSCHIAYDELKPCYTYSSRVWYKRKGRSTPVICWRNRSKQHAGNFLPSRSTCCVNKLLVWRTFIMWCDVIVK